MQELDETAYWLELLVESGIVAEETAAISIYMDREDGALCAAWGAWRRGTPLCGVVAVDPRRAR